MGISYANKIYPALPKAFPQNKLPAIKYYPKVS